jgi:hypothetical protein
MANDLQFLDSFKTDGLVSNFDLLNIFGKGYDEYRIYLNLTNAGSNGGYMGLRVYDNSGTLVDGNEYQHAGVEMKSFGSYDNTYFGSNANQINPMIVGMNDDDIGGGAIIRIFNPDVAQFTFVTGESTTQLDSGLNATIVKGCHKVAEIVSGIRLIQHTSKSLRATIYGVKG